MIHPLELLIAAAFEAAREAGGLDPEPDVAPSESAPQILTAEGWRPLRRPE